MLRNPSITTSKRVQWELGHLDALRGIAILGVVLVHSALAVLPPGQRSGAMWDFLFFGQRGVQLFFLVSAFTLFLSLQHRKQELHPTRNFFIRRFFRIAPLLYVALGLTYWLLRPAAGPPLDMLLSACFLNGFFWRSMLHGAAGGWSIANEAIFYALLPLLHRWITSLRASLYALFLAVPVCLVSLHMGAHFSQNLALKEYFMFFGFAAEFPVFLLGVVVFFIWQEFGLSQDGNVEKRRLLSAFVLFSVVLAFFAELPSDNPKLWPGSMLCASLLLALCLYSWRVLVNRATIYLGKISYSIYLLHFFVVNHTPQWIADLGGASLLSRYPAVSISFVFLLTLAVICPVATLSWLWIEEPGIRLGRRLIAYLEGQTRASKHLVPSIEAVVSVTNSADAQF